MFWIGFVGVLGIIIYYSLGCESSPRTPFPERYYGLGLGMSLENFEKRYPDLQNLPRRSGHSSSGGGRNANIGITVEYLLVHDKVMTVICDPEEGKGITSIIFRKSTPGVRYYKPRKVKSSGSYKGNLR